MSSSSVFHVVVGAGATGSATALLLAESGERVRIVTRRGTGPEHPLIERVAADATDAARLVELTCGARTLFNCAMPAYDRWPTDWPPLAAALLTAAERSGAHYVMLGNVYGYGPVDGPMTEDLPMAPSTVKGRVRAAMWTDALAAHVAGRVRVTEVRASDFVGAGAASLYNFLVVPHVLAGTPAALPGDPDAPRSWSYIGDVARTLVAAARSTESWGRAWHVPSSTRSARAVTARLAELTGSPVPRLTRMTAEEVRAIGKENPIIAEVEEMLYLTENDSILDATLTTKILDVTAAPLDTVLPELAATRPEAA
ncbi:NAD-dependent epimerase/dehydratase family protein [Embleya scabrispora]|uniref:NAD-dependent epimerase/dehydratase family protein n=1 Tax=Embleya scabrispora TaxID=159449 RepID=UPI00037D7B54|nr:NAD-dependent epimerase/dehydratase family protein [Embleya scabrispora]MYS78796.1 NAD-dependent epimerase/dehydratase family protein [Streptomyces sp. SID5474]